MDNKKAPIGSPLSEAEIQEIIDFYNSDPFMSVNETVAALKRCSKTVMKYLSERKVPLHARRTGARKKPQPIGKICRECQEFKTNDLLQKNGVIYTNLCRKCRNERRRGDYAHATGDDIKEYVRNQRKKNPIPHRKYDLKKRFRLTWEEYCKLFASQGNACAGCRVSGDINERGIWHVDHDHDCCPQKHGKTCGKCIRGILCKWCNMTLGNAKESSNRLRELADYLESYNLVRGKL